MITDLRIALNQVEIALADGEAEYGPDVMEEGGWVEIVRIIAAECTPEIATQVEKFHGLLFDE